MLKKISLHTSDHMIVLRPIMNVDAAVLLELNNDKRVQECVVGNPKTVSMEEQIQWMNKIGSEDNIKRLIVELDGDAIGTLIFSDIDSVNQTAVINIKILPTNQGKGIGTEALKLGCEYAFYDLNLYCLIAHILQYNVASQRAFSKAGFKREGILRGRVVKQGERQDLLSYSLLRTEFRLR